VVVAGVGDFTNIMNAVGVFVTPTALSVTVFSDGGTATGTIVTATKLYYGDSTPTFNSTAEADNSAIIYAQELFNGGAVSLPSEDKNYQVVKYETSGPIKEDFDVNFKLNSPATFKEAHLVLIPAGAVAGKNCSGVVGTATPSSGASVTFPVKIPATQVASCSMDDGTQLYMIYRLDNTASLLKELTPVEMTVGLYRASSTKALLNIQRTIKVATAKKAAKVEIIPETGAQGFVFISALDNDTKFVNKAPPSLGGTNPYLSSDLVKIGYVKVSGDVAADSTGKKQYQLGSLAGDKATLEISDGQFAASKATVGSSAKPYINAGSTIIDPATMPLADDTTATFNLTNSHLTAIAAESTGNDANGDPKMGAAITIRVDGTTPINIPEVEPSATMTVTMGTTPASNIPVEPSTLRRFIRDGKICWVYNVPSPTADGAAVKDFLTIRIINSSKVPTKIVGTLYEQVGGEAVFESVPLLDLLDASKAKVLTLEGANYLLNANSVVRLDAADIAAVAKASGGTDSWPGTRRVLKIQSDVTDLEVLAMIRNTQNVELQPQSNISTGVTGNSCQ
jgi:hypothetical protein